MGKKKPSSNNNNNKQKDSQKNDRNPKEKMNTPDFEWKFTTNECPKVFEDQIIEEMTQYALKLFEDQIQDPDVKDIIHSQLRNVIFHYQDVTQEQSAALLKWMLYHNNVEVIKENWKDKVTNSDYKGVSLKISSGSWNKYKRVSDDIIYREHPVLMKYLPRGLVFIRHKTDLDKHVDLALFANRKFYGRKRGDDDDSDICSTIFRDQQYSHFVISNKANGESCQVALLRNGETWLIGSKNRKLVANKKEELSMYLNDKMYKFSAEMAQSFFDLLEQFGPKKVDQLKTFLKTTGLTLNFEFESVEHQHIVPLYKTRLVLIGCTGIHVRDALALHPLFTQSFASYFGFPCVIEDAKLYPASEAEHLCTQITQRSNDEGAVLILLNEKKEVVDLVKVKTWWYILLRAMREKLKFEKKKSILVLARSVAERFKVLGKELGIPSVTITKMTLLSQSFIRFVSANSQHMAHFVDQFPMIWHSFLKQQNLPTDFSELMKAEITGQPLSLDSTDLPVLVMTQGLPGLGKSAASAEAIKMLQVEYGVSGVVIAQDDFYHLSKKKAGALCLEHTTKVLEEKKHQVVILARNNANVTQYKGYLELELQGKCKMVFIAPEEWGSNRLDLIYVCICSIFHRKKVEEGHPTSSMENVKLAELPLFFNRELDVNPGAFKISMLKSTSDLKYNRTLLEDIIKKKKQMDLEALEQFQFLDSSYVQKVCQEYHRALLEVSCEMAKIIYSVLKLDIPSQGSYLAAVLHSEHKSRLLEAVQKPSWKEYAHHATLVHSVDFFNNIETWKKVYEMLGTEVVFDQVQIVTQEDFICAAKVKILVPNQDNNNNENTFTDISNCVASQVPHITIAVTGNASPKDSLKAIKNAKDCSPLTFSPPLRGTIQLIAFD